MLLYSDYLLKDCNSFKINAKADFLIEITSALDLENFARKKKFFNLNRVVLGNGTNILFTSDFKGVILKNNTKGIEIVFQNDDHVEIKVASGENFDDFVAYCVKNRFCGLENLSGIPGSVGGAAVQNIGAYGAEVSSVVKNVEYFDFESLEIKNIDKKDCNFGYRSSVFKNILENKTFITSVTFVLNKKFSPNIEYGNLAEIFKDVPIITPTMLRRRIIEMRNEKLPDFKTFGNAGSFFKNPELPKAKAECLKSKFPELKFYPSSNEKNVKLSAGQLIDICGFKQTPDPKVGVWENQALVVVNYGNATGRDIVSFEKKIIKAVKEKFSIELEPEVCII